MKRSILTLLALSLLLSGCGSWMDGEYHSIEPYTGQSSQEEQEITQVSSYNDICDALEDMVQSAVENGTLSTQLLPSSRLKSIMDLAVRYIKETFPLGAYAVEDITYEIGTALGTPAIAVTVHYNHNSRALSKIRVAATEKAVESLLERALNDCSPSLVMLVSDGRRLDCLQYIRDYALENPSQVMELPQVTVLQYPEGGTEQVIELQFTYQNSREDLLTMQRYVQPVFSSAALYVSGESSEKTKFDLLYSFLMERNSYTQETSLTPSYSLLRHGVGDSKAFACVYAAMCRRAGLDCQIVTGTRDGQPRFWNIICQEGSYRHVDLLRCYKDGAYHPRTDDQMQGYVWDYSAYPACTKGE